MVLQRAMNGDESPKYDLWLKGLGQEIMSGKKTRLDALAVPLMSQGAIQKVGDESHGGLLHQKITILGFCWKDRI